MNGCAEQPGQSGPGRSIAAALAFAERSLRDAASADIDARTELPGEARALVRLAAGVSDTRIYSDPHCLLDDQTWARLRSFVERRAAGEPFAYIELARGFHALELNVNPGVLIPRPETELIVDYVIEHAPAGPYSVADLGTGSGAIALAIAHAHDRARVSAVDISADALAVARGNAERLGLAIECRQSDWFDSLPARRFDFLCSNPPYVRTADPHLQQLRYEPHLALDGGADGLQQIRRILAVAPAYLADGGRLVLEHGYDQAADVNEIAVTCGLQRVALLRDLGGHERVSVFSAAELDDPIA